MGRGSNKTGGQGAAMRQGPVARMRQARAEQRSAGSFRAGVDAWVADDLDSARRHFAQAHDLDPTNADALLGLQYVDPVDVEACERLYVMRSRVGSYQQRPEYGIRGRAYPMHFQAHDIVTAPDTALAYASALAHAGRRPEAEEILRRHAGELADELLAGLEARIAYDAGDYHKAARLTEKLIDIPQLGADPALLHGAALLFSGRPADSRPHLVAARLHSAEPAAARWATYLLGVSYEHTGDQEAAQRMLQQVAASDPGYLDVRDRLTALSAGHGGGVPHSAPDDAFELLRHAFESDNTADDPSIPDNQ